jgi:hypothetical protein
MPQNSTTQILRGEILKRLQPFVPDGYRLEFDTPEHLLLWQIGAELYDTVKMRPAIERLTAKVQELGFQGFFLAHNDPVWPLSRPD